MSDAMKLYPDQDPAELGDYYVRHLSAMTEHGLHDKADIAAQLAWRDREIARLAAQAPAQEPVRWMYELVIEGQVVADGFERERKELPFGRPGVDFSPEAQVIETPLYAHPAAQPDIQRDATLEKLRLAIDRSFDSDHAGTRELLQAVIDDLSPPEPQEGSK